MVSSGLAEEMAKIIGVTRMLQNHSEARRFACLINGETIKTRRSIAVILTNARMIGRLR